MKIFRRILLVLAVIIVPFLIIVALQPPDFEITRTATMAAAPPAVFVQVNDFHNWQKWSPWSKLDPAAKATFEGPTSGTGAIFRWVGNKDVGEGNMVIRESRPNELIQIDLQFIKPFPATNVTKFTFKPEANQTVVTWTMSGQNNFMGRAFCLFMNMDKMVGGDFERGLAALKAVVETKAKPSVPNKN